MSIPDQHMHSSFSFDCQEPLENYLKKFPSQQLYTTEHLDFGNPLTDYQDCLPDYPAYLAEIKHLATRYQRTIFTGIEIGYVQASENAILHYLQDKNFTLRLLSIHHNGHYDFMQKEILNNSVADIVQEYYSLMITALESPINANVLAHFDYGLRLIPLTVSDLIEYGGKLLDKVLELTIRREMAFELNSKSIFSYQKKEITEYVLDCYLSKGGRLITLGSDAHETNYYGYRFADLQTMLTKRGITEIVQFEPKCARMCQITC